jgi:hypothetical protein
MSVWRSLPSIRTTGTSAATSPWHGTASDAESTSTSPIRFPILSPRCGRPFTPASRRSPTAGARHRGRATPIRSIMPRSLSCATRLASAAPRRSSCDMAPATTIACTRTSTGTSHFPSRSRCFCRNRAGTSLEGNSSSPSRGRACRAAPRSYPSPKVTRSPSRSTIGRSKAPAGPTGSICAMA